MALADAVVNEGLSRLVSFKSIIDAYLISRKEFHPFRAELSRNTLVGFHPSGMHGACPRALAYGYLHEKKFLNEDMLAEGVDDKVNYPQQEIIFDFGHLIHMLIQYGYLGAYVPDAQVEVPVTALYEKYLIGGTADIIIRLQDKQKYVIDIKTAKQEVFYKLTKDPATVPMTYRVQLMLYMFGLGIPRGGFLWVNKNTGERKEHFFTLDKALIAPVLKNAELSVSYLKNKKTPPILAECNRKTGKYERCPFTAVCFRAGKRNVVHLTTKTTNGELFDETVKE